MEARSERVSRPIKPLDIAILIGGKASRMGGRPKESLAWKGETFGEILAKLSERLPVRARFFSTSARKSVSRPGWQTVEDLWADVGPMGGIVSVLSKSISPAVLFMACDMPCISFKVALFLVLTYQGEEALFLEGPTGHICPTFGIYHKSLTQPLEQEIFLHQYSLKRALNNLAKFHQIVRIPFEKWAPLDPEGHSLTNVNTWEEYRALMDHRTSDSDRFPLCQC